MSKKTGGTVNVPGLRTALSTQLDDSPRVKVKLVPLGVTKANDGRVIELSEDGVRSAIAMFKAHGTPLPVDYEHQTLGGGKAPAAGFMHDLVEEDGWLTAIVEWNADARSEIRSGQYRYLSPVVLHEDDDRRVVGIHSAGLTNKPALPHMERLAAKEQTERKESHMQELIKKLAGMLGLADGASSEEVLNACAAKLGAMKSSESSASAMKSSLGIATTASDAEVAARVLALKEEVNQVTALKRENETLKREKAASNADALVERFVKENKINPNNKEHLTACKTWAAENPQAFEAHYKTADAIVPSGQTVPPAKESVPAAGDEDAMIATALKENNNNHKTALVSLQGRLMGEQTAKGLTNKAAREHCEKKYPKIFGAAA